MNSSRMSGTRLVALMSLVIVLGQSAVCGASPNRGNGPSARALSLTMKSPESAACPLNLRWSIRRRASVSLAICDPNGWVIQSLVDDTMEPGEHVAVWDGRDETGRLVPTNAFLAVLRVDGRALSQPFILRPSRLHP